MNLKELEALTGRKFKVDSYWSPITREVKIYTLRASGSHVSVSIGLLGGGTVQEENVMLSSLSEKMLEMLTSQT